MTKQPLVIVGGGIAGLASALAVSTRDVVLLEKTASFGEVGAGLQLGPNAVAALRQLGAWDAVCGLVLSPPEIHMRDGRTGRLLKRIVLGTDFERRFGAPYRTAHRADLHAALLDVVRDRAWTELRLGVAVEGVQKDDAAMRVSTGSSGAILAEAVIAADGVHSVLRQSAFPGAQPVDSGLRFHRALIEMPRPHQGVALDCVNVWMLPGGHVVHYPVGSPVRLNIVFVAASGVTPVRLVDRAAKPLQEMADQFADRAPWPGLFVAPLARWNAGRLLLLGDAAHATLPFLAQGAAMALEDAASLKQSMSRADAFVSAFEIVSRERISRTRRLHIETLKAGETYHLTGAMAWARNNVLRALPSSLFWRRLNWLYSHPTADHFPFN